MFKQSLEFSFLKFCEENKYEKNSSQLKIINFLNDFISPKIKFFDIFFKSKKNYVFISVVTLE